MTQMQDNLQRTPGFYAKQGQAYYPFKNPKSIIPKLTENTYQLSFDPDQNSFYLTPIEDFTLPAKIYGNNNSYSDTILDTFMDSREGKITSVVLSGLKGSGKTLTAKQISIKAAAKGIPTIVVSSPFTGNGFINFLTHISAPFILFIDEFEKVYSTQEALNNLLTLLDGTMQAHMLCVMTMNSTLDNDRFQFFKNRPGRVYYNIYYPSCTPEIIREYLEENLQDKSQLERVINFTYRFRAFTLDLLSVLVNEINLHPTRTINEHVAILNVKPDADLTGSYYDYGIITPEGKTFKNYELTISPSPFKIPSGDYRVVNELLTYDRISIEYKVYAGESADFKYLSKQYELDDPFDDVDEVSSFYRFTLDSISDSVLKTNPALAALAAATPRENWDETIAGFEITMRLKLRDVEEKRTQIWEMAVDYQTRNLTLTNKIFGFKFFVQGKPPSIQKEYFLL